MALQLALIAGFLVTFGIMLVVVGTAVVTGQRANRAEMRRIQAELVRIGHRIDRSRGRSR
jgi:hypothetical protein